MQNYSNEIAFIAILLAALVAFYLIHSLNKQMNHAYDVLARLTMVTERHESEISSLRGEIKILALNTETDEAKDVFDKKQKDQDDLYNEGMSNIFGYSVKTGIEVNGNA